MIICLKGTSFIDIEEDVVKFTLPEGQKQIFVSKYVPYLPTEDELKAELLREKELVEMEFKLKKDIS